MLTGARFMALFYPYSKRFSSCCLSKLPSWILRIPSSPTSWIPEANGSPTASIMLDVLEIGKPPKNIYILYIIYIIYYIYYIIYIYILYYIYIIYYIYYIYIYIYIYIYTYIGLLWGTQWLRYISSLRTLRTAWMESETKFSWRIPISTILCIFGLKSNYMKHVGCQKGEKKADKNNFISWNEKVSSNLSMYYISLCHYITIYIYI